MKGPKSLYIVFRCSRCFEWESEKTYPECITSDRESAEKIVKYLEEHEECDGDIYHTFWYSEFPVVTTYEQFIKDYIETNAEV